MDSAIRNGRMIRRSGRSGLLLAGVEGLEPQPPVLETGALTKLSYTPAEPSPAQLLSLRIPAEQGQGSGGFDPDGGAIGQNLGDPVGEFVSVVAYAGNRIAAARRPMLSHMIGRFR